MFNGLFESASNEEQSKRLLQENPLDLRKVCDECHKRIDFGIITHSHPIVGFHFCLEHAFFLKTGSPFHVYIDDGYWGFKCVFLKEGKILKCSGCKEQIEPETVCFSLLQKSGESGDFVEHYHPDHTREYDTKMYERPRCVVLTKGKQPSYEKIVKSINSI